MSSDYPDDRVIAWVNVRGEDGTQKQIPWLRDPKTSEELEESESAKWIIQKAQDQERAQIPLSGKQRRHRQRRLGQQRNRLRRDTP